MRKNRFRCRCCKKIKAARIKGQKFCSSKECQRARRNAWYQEKCATDPDYRANQRASNQAWLEAQGGSAAYFRDYRKRRKSTEALQSRSKSITAKQSNLSEGSRAGVEGKITDLHKSAKLDVAYRRSSQENTIKTGRYIIIPVHKNARAKLDATIVEIAMISSG